MVYNVTYTPTDTANIFQDLFATFLSNGIIYAGVIILAIIVIVLIKYVRSK